MGNSEDQIIQTEKKHWHDKNYKSLLIIPLLLIIFSLIFLVSFYYKNGDFIYKDVSLSGGTSITINDKIDSKQIKEDLQTKLDEINTKEIYDLTTHQQKAIIIETKSDSDTAKQILEKYIGYELNSENSSFEFTGSALSEGFYKQLLISILIAFIFMGVVVFIIFRTFIPSVAVILSAFANVLLTITTLNILKINMSTSGIIALLLLIGYSVDTDLLLTNRLLKRKEGNLNSRIYTSFKTGMSMTLTSLFAFLAVLMVVNYVFNINILAQIFIVLCIGLFFDLINTWITNVSILKWYALKKGIK